MDTLDRIRKELQDRVAELEPLVHEYQRLRAAEAALGGTPAPAARRPSDDATGGAGGAARRGSAPRGSARDAILAAAREHPGAKRGEIARITGLAPATVGSTLAKLRAEGLLPRPQRSAARAAAPEAEAETAPPQDGGEPAGDGDDAEESPPA